MPDFKNLIGFYRAISLFVIYSYQLFANPKYIPEEIWKDELYEDDGFDDIVDDLTGNGYVERGEYESGPGYSITDSGKALLWIYLDKLRDAAIENSEDDGETLVNAVFLSLQTYVTAMRKRQMGCYDVLADDGSGWSWFPSKN